MPEGRSRQASGINPLPAPETLAEFERVLPGLADRITAMAEKQAEHRRHCERIVVEGNLGAQRVALFLGFIIVMTAIISGAVLIGAGHGIAGLVAIIGALVGLVSVFVYGKRAQKLDRIEQLRQFGDVVAQRGLTGA